MRADGLFVVGNSKAGNHSERICTYASKIPMPPFRGTFLLVNSATSAEQMLNGRLGRKQEPFQKLFLSTPTCLDR